MKKLFLRKSILLVWAFAYFLVVLIPIVFNLLVYMQSQDVLADNVRKVNQNSMEATKKEMDSLVSSMLNAYIDLSYSAGVKRIAAMNDTQASGYQYEMYQTIQDLRKFNNYVTGYAEYYVYFKKLDLVVSAKEPVSDRIFFSDMQIQDISFEDWKSRVQSGGNEYLRYQAKDGSRNVMYYNPLAWQDGKYQDVIFLARLRQDVMRERLQSMYYGEQGTLAIFNQSNEVLISVGEIKQETADLISSIDIGNGTVQKDGIVITVSPSSVVNWKYVYILPEKVLFSDVAYMRIWTIASIVLSVLISGVIIYFILKKQYTPINKLVSMFGKEDYVGKVDEFSFLENKLSETLTTKAEAEKALDKQKKHVRINYLRRFVKGLVEDEASVNNILQAMNCETVGKKYVILQFYVRDYTCLFADDETLHNEQRIDLANLIIENIGTELIETSYNCFMFECDDMMVALVLADEKEKNNAIENTLLEYIDNFNKIIRENFNIECCVSVSQVINSCLDIPLAYQEATDAIEYAIVSAGSKVVRYDEVAGQRRDGYQFNYELKQEFVRAMKSANIEAGIAIVDTVLENNADLDETNIQGMVVDFVAVILRGVNEIYRESGGTITQKDVYQIQKLLFCTDAKELRSGIEMFLKNVCDKASVLYGEDNLVSRIKIYVEENYMDSNLNVATLGERFSKTPHYISKLFKDEQGFALLDYINCERILHAKQLLVATKKTLAEITEEVGFTNVVTFIRVFKKFEGVTPGKFRETPPEEI